VVNEPALDVGGLDSSSSKSRAAATLRLEDVSDSYGALQALRTEEDTDVTSLSRHASTTAMVMKAARVAAHRRFPKGT